MKEWLILIVWLFIGLALLLYAALSAWRAYDFRREAQVIHGKVVEVETVLRDQSYIEYPVIEYLHPTGQIRKYKARSSSSLADYSVGESIDLLYDPISGSIKLDSFSELFFFPLFLLVVSGFVLFLPILGISLYLWIWGWPTSRNREAMRQKIGGVNIKGPSC